MRFGPRAFVKSRGVLENQILVFAAIGNRDLYTEEVLADSFAKVVRYLFWGQDHPSRHHLVGRIIREDRDRAHHRGGRDCNSKDPQNSTPSSK